MPAAPALPPPDRLDAAISALARAGQRRLLISTVETWADRGSPTVNARLAQVRALLELGMTDRAWTRLRALPPGSGEEAEQVILQTRLFLEHGWPDRATKSLATLRELAPDHPDIPKLARAIAKERLGDDPEISGATMARRDALRLVRKEMAQGAIFRARQLLDTFEKHWPADPSFGDLRWALVGDYRLRQTTLDEVASRWGGTAAADEDEDTMDIDMRGEAFQSAPLPRLFGDRRDEVSEVSGTVADDPESTAAMYLDDVLRAADGAPSQPTPEEDDAGDAEDEPTQLLRVMRRSQGPSTEPGQQAPAPVEPTEMEFEDDDVVVMTHDRASSPPVETRMPRAAAPMPERLPLPITQPYTDPGAELFDDDDLRAPPPPLASEGVEIAQGMTMGQLALGVAAGGLLVLSAATLLAWIALS